MQRCEAMHASRATRARLVTKKVRAAQSNRNACTVTEATTKCRGGWESD